MLPPNHKKKQFFSISSTPYRETLDEETEPPQKPFKNPQNTIVFTPKSFHLSNKIYKVPKKLTKSITILKRTQKFHFYLQTSFQS